MKKFIALILSMFLSVCYAETVKVIIPFAPGGGTDLVFKHFQKFVEEKHNTILVPFYKPGAESVIGLSALAESPKDGSVIGIGTVAGIINLRTKNTEYNFDYISMLGKTSMAVVSNPNSGIKNINDLEREIKSTPVKKNFAYGAPAQRIVLSQLFLHNNADAPTFIVYSGAAPMLNDLLGGHTDVAVAPLAVVKQHTDSGKLLLIASTMDKQGVNLHKQYPAWKSTEGFVLMMPENSNKTAYAKWSQLAVAYLSDPETVDFFTKNFLERVPAGAAEVQKNIR